MSENNKVNSSSGWTLEDRLITMGWLIIVVGFIGALTLGLSLETVESYYYSSSTYNVPHPMRWIYAGVSFMSTLFLALIMFGLAEILKRLDTIGKVR